MGARWAWDAVCNDCGHKYGGFSGGADDCPKCQSENVTETPDVDFFSDMWSEMSGDR